MDIKNLSSDAESFTSNAYLINDTVLIDTGADRGIVAMLEDHDIETVIITHTHWDHIKNLPLIVAAHEPEVYAYEPENLPVPAEQLETGNITIDGIDFEVIHTPGHKNDSVCLYVRDEKILFSGDLIFPHGSFGRTDLDEGDRDTLIDSIETIAELDVAALYPGHETPTTEDVNSQIQDSLTAAGNHEKKYD